MIDAIKRRTFWTPELIVLIVGCAHIGLGYLYREGPDFYPLMLVRDWLGAFDDTVLYPVLHHTYPLNEDGKVDETFKTLAMSEILPCSHDEFVVLVKSRPYAFEKRQKMRSYLSNTLAKDKPLLFFIGIPESGFNVQEEETLYMEQELYHDVVRGPYPDSYMTLRVKEFVRATYFSQHCTAPNALLLDDDVQPSITPSLVRHLIAAETDVSCLYKEWRGAQPSRDLASRWYTSSSEYPYPDWPTYCGGPCMAMSKSASSKIVDEASRRQFIYDGSKSDVYLTGIFRILSGVKVDAFFEDVCLDHDDHRESVPA